MKNSAGRRFKDALKTEKPLQVVGAVNAYCAKMAEAVGFKALYLSGAGVANMSYGVPDVGITTLDNVLEDTQRITSATDLPLVVDIDTGWGNEFTIARSIQLLERARAAGVQIEDQVFFKKCGHLANKQLVAPDEMVGRIKAAVAAREDPDFLIIARTDALAVEGFENCLERCLLYKEAGSDILFAEAFTSLDQYTKLRIACGIPILANITEFGRTPLFSKQQLASAGVDIALYPLSAARAMNLAALKVYQDIMKNGSQDMSVANMQTREELYRFLGYKEGEKLCPK